MCSPPVAPTAPTAAAAHQVLQSDSSSGHMHTNTRKLMLIQGKERGGGGGVCMAAAAGAAGNPAQANKSLQCSLTLSSLSEGRQAGRPGPITVQWQQSINQLSTALSFSLFLFSFASFSIRLCQLLSYRERARRRGANAKPKVYCQESESEQGKEQEGGERLPAFVFIPLSFLLVCLSVSAK